MLEEDIGKCNLNFHHKNMGLEKIALSDRYIKDWWYPSSHDE